MPIKNLTLGLCLLLAGSALAQNTTYKVREGDTLSGIAHKFSVRQKAILEANSLPSADRLRVGRTIAIPNATVHASKSSSHSTGGSRAYKVRNGDFDWAIAKRNGITVAKLHSLNPNVDWDSLQVGTSIHLPGSGSSKSSVASVSKPDKSGGVHTYTVQKGENDWIIARRAGMKLSVLKKLNSDINLNKLRPGQKIKLLAGAGSMVAHHEKVNHIRTSYALINSDDVSVRRSPAGERICTVDTGTRAKVVDREGQWYKLRFPKGTVAWVRGDFLNPAHSDRVASRKRRHSSETRVVSRRRHHKGSYSRLVASNVNSEDLLERAKGWRGVRYSYGSASRSATDCSGFTSQVFRGAGVKLPRSSREQAHVGQHVPKSELKKGDLLIFAGTRGGRVGHVGIYEGNGKFIHASSGKGHVTESSLSDPYYARRLKEGRRVAIKKKKSSTKVATKAPEGASHSDPTPTVVADGGGN